MAPPRRTIPQLREAIRLLNEHGSIKAAADASGIPVETFRHTVKAARAKLGAGGVPAESQVVTGDGHQCEITKTTAERVRTLADLIRVCDIDIAEWEIERWVCNKWDSAAKLGADEKEHIAITELYQIKVWLKRKVAMIAARQELVQLREDAAKGFPKLARLAPKRKAPSGNLLEVNIADLHNGKLAWGPETGYDNYDSKIAETIHDEAVSVILARTAGHQFDEIAVILGNDLLHIDSRTNATTAGTPQDTDSRYYKLFLSTRRMVTRAIDRFRTKARVRVVMVPGNHDSDSVWHLGDSLVCWYRDCHDVTIDNTPTQRKYLEFGRVMLMFTHGDKGKREDYPLLMATEQPEMFGRTKYREAHTGHLHQTRVQEYHGVRVRILPSLSETDAWHAGQGFVGNLRVAEAFVWNAAEGLVATAYYTVPGDEQKGAAA